MDSIKKIPFGWFKYQNQSAYFITYHGDIYQGYLTECPNYENGFFIISKNEAIEFQELKNEERTPERYRQLGWEIQDRNIIKHIEPDDGATSFGSNINFKPLKYNNQDFKKMFVFGAAASSFCVFGDRTKQFRESALNPPTGFEIFDEKYDKYCRKYPGVIQSISGFEAKQKDIEACMEEEWQQFKGSYNPRVVNRHVNIQYYMRELFQDISTFVKNEQWRNNLYSLFTDRIQKYVNKNSNERIGIVSFNYDTILERFIEDIFGLGFNSMNDYIDWDARNVMVFKPHGSCNWGWRFRNNQQNGVNQKITVGYLFEKQIEPYEIYYNLLGDPSITVATNSWGLEKGLNKSNLGRFTINKSLLEIIPPNLNDDFFPALLLPYRDKDEFVMPYDHYEAMRHFFGEMEELYLIGWKGNEELFNRQIGQHAHKLKKIVVANPNADEVLRNLTNQSGLDIKNCEVETVKYFEEFVLESIGLKI